VHVIEKSHRCLGSGGFLLGFWRQPLPQPYRRARASAKGVEIHKVSIFIDAFIKRVLRN
jgi:hypothetical protein